VTDIPFGAQTMAPITQSRTALPPMPFDGQEFVDSEGIKWIYDKEDRIWTRVGQAEMIPLASAVSDGLLSAADKAFIDSLPEVGGDFGIIVGHSELLLAHRGNPDGVLVGDIVLFSESMDIVCLDNATATPNKLSCDRIICEGSPLVDNQPPGIGFRLSDRFLANLFINVAGPPGSDGDQGPDGVRGNPGFFSNGPKGDQGPSGDSSDIACTLKEFVIEDVPGIFDAAVVDLKITPDCQVVLTKSQVAMADNNNPPSHVLATPLIRTLVYPEQTDSCAPVTLDDWQLQQPANDTSPLDLLLIRLPNNGDCSQGQQITAMPLTDFIKDIVNCYKSRLQGYLDMWLQQAKGTVEQGNNTAANVLANLAQEALDCQRQECISVPH
jgi:hypothetical protein